MMRRYGSDNVDPYENEDEISAEVERIFQDASPDIEVKVRMININHGCSCQLLSACRPLREYAWFVAQARAYHTSGSRNGSREKMEMGDAIDQAIDDMPDDFEIKKFITANRAEVKDMCLTEYNEAETMELLRQEAIQEGMQEGLKKGLQKGQYETMLLNINNLMSSMGWTAEKTMDSLQIPLSQRDSLYAALIKK